MKSFDGIDKLLDNQIGMAKKQGLKVSVCHITRDVLSSSSYQLMKTRGSSWLEALAQARTYTSIWKKGIREQVLPSYNPEE